MASPPSVISRTKMEEILFMIHLLFSLLPPVREQLQVTGRLASPRHLCGTVDNCENELEEALYLQSINIFLNIRCLSKI